MIALVAVAMAHAPARAQQDAFATATPTARATSSAALDGAGLLGLKSTAAPPAFTVDELVQLALDGAPDAKLATERVVQQDAALRRAWALLLPTLSMGGAYAHTCTGGGSGVDCGDRTASFADPEQLEQQALLFQTLADVMGVAAANAADPDDAANFRARQVELTEAADDIRKADVTPVVVQPASQLSGQLTLAVPLFNPRAYPALLSALDGRDAARLAAQQARQALVLSVVRAAYATVTAERVVAAATRSVELATQQAEAVGARIAASTQPPLAEKRAQLELLRARQTLAQARAAADNAIAVVGGLLGRDEQFSIRADALAPPPLAATLNATDTDALVAAALDARLEVRAQRTVLQIAERGITDAWMQFLPTIGLSATARVTSFTQGFVRDPVTGVLTVSATLPLYDGGVRYAALDDSTSRASEERVRLRQLEDRVAAQVRGNLRDVLVRQEAAALATQAHTVALEAQAQARALFDAGVGTALDVTETNVAVFAAETDLLRAELDLKLAHVSLQWATGAALADGI